MILLIHGSNQMASRQHLISLIQEAKLNKKEIIELNGLTLTLNELIQALEAASLFGQEKLIVLENLFSRPASQEKEGLVKYLKLQKNQDRLDHSAPGAELVLWEKNEISGTTTRWLPKNWRFELFKTPVIIFKLLDSLRPGNAQLTLNLLKSCLQKETPEMVFYMIIRRVRELIIAYDLGKAGLKGAPWQIGKLITQAKNFTLKQLTIIDQQLLNIDIDIKTGRSIMPLDWHLDMLMADL